jgi:anaerobic ribonucleoside-triphosphate reductase
MPERLPCRLFMVNAAADAICAIETNTAPSGCPNCPDYIPLADNSERTVCEVWTRVMGYHRPVSAFNDGKKAEHAERRAFREYHLREGCGHD